MTEVTRRTALMGATAAVAVVGLPTPVVAHTSEPLISLEAELLEARAATSKVGALYTAAHDKAGNWAFGWPMVDFHNPVTNLMRGWLRRNGFGGTNENRVSLDCIKRFNLHTETLVYGGDEVLARCKIAGRKRIRWWIKARRAQEAAQEAAGIPDIHALLDSNHERQDAIEDQLWDTPAETLQGVVIRMREAHRDYVSVNCCDDDGDFYAAAFGKVLSDLERLTGEVQL